MKAYERKVDAMTRKSYMVEVEISASDVLPDCPYYEEVTVPNGKNAADYADELAETTKKVVTEKAGKVYRQL